jgi:sugar O-acyltransferase (sialic acid O-acetyltransferase NeuD family)
MAGRLLILGAGGHGRAVADLATECGWTVAGFTDRSPGPGVLGEDGDVAVLARDGKIDGAVVGVGNTALVRRAELFAMLTSLRVATPTLIHPRATVSRTCKIGDGVVIFPSVVLGAAVEVGDNVVLYSGVIAEHDCRIAVHAYLSPGVILAGNVRVGVGAFIGMGAGVAPGSTVPEGARVRALTFVTGDPAVDRPAKPKGSI